ncbi:Hypothetical predicted protein [Paramuricea clavata]|uniref:Transposable element P transposase-like GTP-binding insertion domain-containing protein n=1 Tax=Paramuricea clavata TaxID=317549 RepID=A0A6S7H9V7_PARCT|nr:Hypothetical predicted protein [Paramuricea clavata]
MVTKFKHPTANYYVYAILDPCHMLQLARNALAHLNFSSLNRIQEGEGFTFPNKFSSKHLQFEKHKMNVKLSAQTLSLSVADAIEFLDSFMELTEFCNSRGTVKFVRTIDRLFDMLNSLSPITKGSERPLQPECNETWEDILKS